MADGVTIEIKGTEKIDQALKRLHGLGARKRDVTKVFSTGMKPLIGEGKNQATVSTGRLRRSIKFRTSKRYKNIWYVFAGRNKNPRSDAFYAHIVGKKNPFMSRAWNAKGESVVKAIEDGLMDLVQKIITSGNGR